MACISMKKSPCGLNQLVEKKLNAQSNVLTLADVSTAAAGFELTIRRLQDGHYTSTATAETMRIEGWRGGHYCLGTSLGSDGLVWGQTFPCISLEKLTLPFLCMCFTQLWN